MGDQSDSYSAHGPERGGEDPRLCTDPRDPDSTRAHPLDIVDPVLNSQISSRKTISDDEQEEGTELAPSRRSHDACRQKAFGCVLETIAKNLPPTCSRSSAASRTHVKPYVFWFAVLSVGIWPTVQKLVIVRLWCQTRFADSYTDFSAARWYEHHGTDDRFYWHISVIQRTG
jgi:hypothetical protein